MIQEAEIKDKPEPLEFHVDMWGRVLVDDSQKKIKAVGQNGQDKVIGNTNLGVGTYKASP